MLRRIPALANDINMALPPWLMNVRGIPVSGATPSMEAMFMKASTDKNVEMPTARYEPKGSCVRAAIWKPRKAKKQNSAMMEVAPAKPSSSPATAKIESPIGSGR